MKHLIKLSTLLLLVATLSQQVKAAPTASSLPGNKVTGKIIEQTSQLPMEYVSIALYRPDGQELVAGAITDKDGKFLIEPVDSGLYQVKISFIGYADTILQKVVVTKRNKTDLGTILLSNATTEINEVNVTAEKSRVEYKIDKRVVNVDKEIAARGGTAVNVLENTPSIQTDAEGNITLRGSSDFVVLIDGKPSIIKGSAALKQIPSETIKQIEVITNPSARYDADGQAGIINVILKKDKMQGLNGNVNTSYGYKDRQSANTTVNFRKNRLNLFTGIDYNDDKYSTNIIANNTFLINNDTYQSVSDVDQYNKHEQITLRGGLDFDMSEKTNLSLSGSYGKQGYDNGSDAWFWSRSGMQADTTYATSSNFLDVKGDVVSLNLDFGHKFADNHKIAFSNSYSSWNGVDDYMVKVFNANANYENNDVTKMLNYTKDNFNYQYRFNIDYNRPLFNGNFETGVQFRIENRWDDLTYRNYNINTNEWIDNDSLSYYLDYTNTIYSGYAVYSNKFLGFDYQLGLRSEYFMRNIDIDNENNPFDYNKFMFYPSVHLSKSFSEKYQMQLSYSRRINRPQPWLLNNTPSYIDENNLFRGNPNLVPEYTDAFEANFRAVQKKVTLSAQTYYRYTTNSFNTVRYLDGNGVMNHQLTNSDYQQAFGIELGGDINLFKWWQINTGANIYNYKLSTQMSDTTNTKTVNTWDARLVNNFKLKWGTGIQSVLYYRAPSVDAVGKSDGFYVVNLGVNQTFLKGALNVNLSVQNMFNSIKFDYSTSSNNFNNIYTINAQPAVYMISLSYNFNNFINKNRGRNDDLQFKGGGSF